MRFGMGVDIVEGVLMPVGRALDVVWRRGGAMMVQREAG